MLKLKLLLFIIIFSFLFTNLFSATYYISNTGDDNNNGLSPVYPLKSISKLNSLIFKMIPGDIVLFERGGIYSGQININATGNENKPLIFGAYGNGKNPVISGSIPVNNWNTFQGNIYRSFVKSQVKDLFVNGERMILARYPNSGYLRIDKPFPKPNNGFTDKELNQKKGYWDSCNVKIRTQNWAYEKTVIQHFKNGSVTFSKPTYFPVKSSWGYYLDNNLNQLDIENEWYYDNNNSKNDNLFLYAPKALNPNTLNVQATVSDCGFFSAIEFTNVVIRDLEFQNQYVGGIYLAKKESKVKIENCTFTGQNLYGIFIPNGSDKIDIINCRFYNITGKALYILKTKNTSVLNNIFRNIGMIPGYGTTSGDAFFMTGMLIFGDNIRISENNIDGVGHNGINCIGTGNIIEKNVLKNTLMLLNDGGAIKCYGNESRNSEWKNNFIFNVQGNLESTDNKNRVKIALGIYLDELANNMTISQNTIINTGSAGIGTSSGYDNIFKYNICYGNDIGVIFYQNEILCRNNNFNNNILFSNNEDQIAILNQSLDWSNIPGKFGSNYYFNPSSYNVFRIMENNIVSDYNFDKWKQFVRSDYNSKLIVSENTENSKLFTNMSNESLTVILSGNIHYKDLNQSSIYGSLTLNPWSSVILFADSEIDKFPEINIAGGPLNFERPENKNNSNPLWYNFIGNNLQKKITITVPKGFLISIKNDCEYTNSLSLYPENGKMDKIIFVIFDPDENKRYYDFISNQSGSVVSKIKVMGNSN